MMDIQSRFSDFYDYLTSDIDPRVQDWLFMQSPTYPFILTSLYLLFIYLGPKWMKHRKAIDIQPILVVYNFTLVILSAYIVHEFLMGGWLVGYTLGCQPVDYSNSPTALRMAGAVWWFFIAKYIELLDTVFFILRKKNNQVTFLHVFHHGLLPVFWWWGVKSVPGGFGTFHGLVNGCVHVAMYLYYGIAALGPQYQKYLWWKRYLTIFQLAQFFIVTIHNSQYLFTSCSYPWKYVAFIQAFTSMVAILFLNFYIKTYKRNPKAGSKPTSVASTGSTTKVKNGEVTSNGNHANGHLATNGHSNGFIQNGYHSNGQTHLKHR